MAEPPAYLIVALSARALAVAARRAGCPAYALDLYGDLDTRANAVASGVIGGDLARGFDECALLAAANRFAPRDARPAHGIVYGAGFEDRPALLERLSRGRRLCGNTPEVVARTKEPHAFFALLDHLRVPHPDVSYSAPHDPEGWLVKRAGGSGGGHVVPAAAFRSQPGDVYWQRRVTGRAIGVSFLADGERACLLGFSEQWASPTASSPFRFGGLRQPAALEAVTATELRALLDPLVRALGLVGLNSLDVLVQDDGRFHVIEVNPRPGANLDVFDGGQAPELFALHVRACEGELPPSWQAPPHTRAMRVVYADAAARVADAVEWPDWVVDRPAPGSIIDARAPLCTVLAAHATTDGACRLVETRVAAVHDTLLVPGERGDRSAAGRMPACARPVPSHPRSDSELHALATRSGTAA